MKQYCRMNPDDRLFEILKEYSKISWGAEAYPLSTAEATYIIQKVDSLLIENKINSQSASNGRNRITELQDRVIEFERIKAQHLEFLKELYKNNVITPK